MERKKIAVVMGTRPEAIKMAPIVKKLQEQSEAFEVFVIATAQHRQMLDQVLSLFKIKPDIDLDLMRPNQSLADLTARVLQMMQQTLSDIRPDLLMIQGDTTTAFAAALAAFYAKIPIAHIEAGLRTHDIYNPFPEEVNRHLISVVTDIHFAPTPLAERKLLNEGVPAAKIAVTGNTVIDALQTTMQAAEQAPELPLLQTLRDDRMLLVTSHRRESWGRDLENICRALRDLVDRFDDLHVIYPVHLNPNVQNTVGKILQAVERIHLIPPVGYLEFIQLMKRSTIVLSDSGGVTEEAPTFKKPLLLLRSTTERPEACHAGMARIVGTDRNRIVEEASRLLNEPSAYDDMVKGFSPYGDGMASARVAKALVRWFQQETVLLEPQEEFRSEPVVL